MAAADACASGSYCQIGGFIWHHSGTQFWFSEKFSHDDFEIFSFFPSFASAAFARSSHSICAGERISQLHSHDDFEKLNIHLDPNMQRSIASFETLAQIALVWLVAKSFPVFDFPSV